MLLSVLNRKWGELVFEVAQLHVLALSDHPLVELLYPCPAQAHLQRHAQADGENQHHVVARHHADDKQSSAVVPAVAWRRHRARQPVDDDVGVAARHNHQRRKQRRHDKVEPRALLEQQPVDEDEVVDVERDDVRHRVDVDVEAARAEFSPLPHGGGENHLRKDKHDGQHDDVCHQAEHRAALCGGYAIHISMLL